MQVPKNVISRMREGVHAAVWKALRRISVFFPFPLYRIAFFGYNRRDQRGSVVLIMSMIEFDEYKVKLNTIRPKLDDLALSLNIESAKEDLDRLHAQIESDGFWDNTDTAQKVTRQASQLEAKIERYEKMCTHWDDLMTICEMAIEENDDSMLDELVEGYKSLEEEMERERLETLLSGEYDGNNAIVSFQAGAGGTEAQDWASMLYRMYTHWTEQHGLSYKILDYLDGDEAGIKSASILIEGENAYGLLKSENGVHRLVRVSPFDANARRQTSFAAVEVIPEITDDSKDVEIRPEDIEMQVYRSSGAGGQHINKTSSAVRLIHKPSGIVVACQEERSQVQNREKCMQMLASKLYQIEQERIESAVTSERRSQVGTGMRNERIRTYNFPQGRVTDHRIGLTLYKIDSIMDGALDELIDALVTADQAEKLQSSGEA